MPKDIKSHEYPNAMLYSLYHSDTKLNIILYSKQSFPQHPKIPKLMMSSQELIVMSTLKIGALSLGSNRQHDVR